MKTLNSLACFVHFVALIVFIALTVTQDAAHKCVPITVSHNVGRPGINATKNSVMGSVCYGFLAVAFEAVCFVAHFLTFLYWESYKNDVLAKHVNPYRWIEYSISASIMLLAILVTVGVTDFGALFTSIGCTVACMFCGYLNETSIKRISEDPVKESENNPWISLIVGSVFGIAPWVTIFYSYSLAATLPWFVHVFVFQLFLFFNSFAFVEIMWTRSFLKANVTHFVLWNSENFKYENVLKNLMVNDNYDRRGSENDVIVESMYPNERNDRRVDCGRSENDANGFVERYTSKNHFAEPDRNRVNEENFADMYDEDYVAKEGRYMMLSLISKLSLGGLIMGSLF